MIQIEIGLKKEYINVCDKIQNIVIINQKVRIQMNAQQELEAQQNQKRDEEEYNTFLYKFEQQIMDAWKPVPYTKNNVILYSVLTVVCIVLGLVLILTAPNSPEVRQRYDDTIDKTTSAPYSISFSLSDTLTQPSYLYYGLQYYYQNHRRYLKFFSPDQMDGTEVDEATAKTQCGENAYTNGQIGATTSVENTPLDSGAIAFPCGQRARSYLKLKPEIDSIKLKSSNGTYINLNKGNVAWPDDPASYKNSGNLNKQAISNDDQAWLVWFRPAAKHNFFKLHSKIEEDLPAGNYFFETNNQFDASFGEKWFFLGKSNYVGNKDYFLGIAFLVLGGGCLVVLIIFIAKCVTEMRGRPKQD